MSELNRQLYIGDLLKLTVDSSYISEKDIQQAFVDFEIVSIEDHEESYEVTLRTFEPGTYDVILGGQDIQVVVKSTLDDIQQDTVMEPDPLLPPEPFGIPYGNYIPGAAAVVATVCCIWLLILWRLGIRKSRQVMKTSPYESMSKVMGTLTFEDKRDLETASKIVRFYVQEITGLPVASMSGREMRGAFEAAGVLMHCREGLTAFFDSCESMLYKGDVSVQEVQRLGEQLRQLVREIPSDIAVKDAEEKEVV